MVSSLSHTKTLGTPGAFSLATRLAGGLGLLLVVFVDVIFAKSVGVFEAVRFSGSCVLVTDSL